RHSEWLEDLLLDVVLVRNSAGFLDDEAKKPEVGVAVQLHGPRREHERITTDGFVDVIASKRRVHPGQSAKLRNLGEVGDARRVTQKMPQRDLVAASVEIRQPLCDLVVD